MTRAKLGGWWIVSLLSMASLGAAGREVPLVEAVKKADTVAVRALLQQRVDVNAAEADGTTALHWAAERDNIAVAQLLIRAGANVKAANRYGVTPLTAACINGNAAMIEAFLNAGADPNATLPEGETALMTAARTGKADALKVLLAHGANVHAKEGWKAQTALMWAAAENHAEAVKMLTEVGADINARANGGFTPLLFAVRAGASDAVRVLLAAGANVNDTVLVPQAAPMTAGRVVPQVAGNPARNSGPSGGPSALHLAVLNAHWQLGVDLLNHGADPNDDGQGWTALHQVAFTRTFPIRKGLPPPVPTGKLDSLGFVKALLAHGGNPNARLKREPKDGVRNTLNRIGATPYLLAGKVADVEMMRFLAANGADTRLPTEDGATPLMAAAGVGLFKLGESAGTNEEALEAVETAWELGSTDVNAVDGNGETALHGAAYRGANTIVQFLVEKGAKLDVRNKIGWTPWTIADGITPKGATYVRYLETADLLTQLGAKDHGVKRPEDLNPADVAAAAAARDKAKQ